TWTASCSARRWSAPCAASTRRPATTSTTPAATSTPSISRPTTAPRSSRATRGGCTRGWARPGSSAARSERDVEGLRQDQRGGAAQGGDVVGGAEDDPDRAAGVVEGLVAGRLLHRRPEGLARARRIPVQDEEAASEYLLEVGDPERDVLRVLGEHGGGPRIAGCVGRERRDVDGRRVGQARLGGGPLDPAPVGQRLPAAAQTALARR